MGGLIGIIVTTAAIIVQPIAYHSFILKAAQKLYTARTKDGRLFEPPKTTLKGELLEKQMQISCLLAYYYRVTTTS